MYSPLDQFKIKKILDLKLFGIDISFTNSSFYMILTVLVGIIFMFLTARKTSVIPGKTQLLGEILYNFIVNLTNSSIGKDSQKFVPMVFSLFMFILLANILGMTPYSFTVTSHIIVTFALSGIAFLVLITYAFIKKGFIGFFKMFIPSGVPCFMAPIIFIIEFFSFLVRPITLAVRLFANIVAGHVLLKVTASFVVAAGLLFGIFPLLFSVIMVGFELFVAILQSYIFSILICAYLGEINNQH